MEGRQFQARSLLPVAVVVAVVAAFWPVWRWYGLRLGDGFGEPWGLAALMAGGWFLWRERADWRTTREGCMAAIALMLAYGMGYSVWPCLGRAALAILAMACLSGTLGRHPAIWGLLVLSLPIVASLQFFLGIPLRQAAAWMAHAVLRMGGCEVYVQGVELVGNGRTVGVDAPCSGVKMLWAGLFLTLLLAAQSRCGWGRTLFALGVGLVAVIVGNGLRVALLFGKESGIVEWPEWAHEGIGLGVFGMVAWGLARWFGGREGAARGRPAPPGTEVGPAMVGLLVALSVAAAWVPGLGISVPGAGWRGGETGAGFPGWPRHWRGHALEEIPLTDQEAAFAAGFPGKIGVFSAGPEKVIVRWVTRPTRLLHPGSDCLRATGYRLIWERPGSCLAAGPGGEFLVEEEIVEVAEEMESERDAKRWREVSAWFWDAALGRSEGPWWAVTAMRRADP